MSDEQTELLKQILAELKAQGRATAEFRAEVHDAGISQRATQAEQHAQWMEEVEAQKQNWLQWTQYIQHQRSLILVAIGLVAVAVALFVWSLRTPPRSDDHSTPALESVEP